LNAVVNSALDCSSAFAKATITVRSFGAIAGTFQGLLGDTAPPPAAQKTKATRWRSLARSKECFAARGDAGSRADVPARWSVAAPATFRHSRMNRSPRLIACALLSLAASSVAAPKPLKVFILAGQSNMEGQAVADLDGKDYNEGKGTLAALLRDPAKAAMFSHLRKGERQWTVRE